MARQLMILEVSQKQAYIFASRKLRDNMLRSAQIAYVTSDAFFRKACPQGYTNENMIYSGGGHTVLQFESKQQATAFAEAVTGRVLVEFPGMELFVRQLTAREDVQPAQALLELSQRLEFKKSHRKASFRCFDLGVEQAETAGDDLSAEPDGQVPDGWKLTVDTEEMAAGNNFLAVVHLDGNSMGKRVQKIYNDCGSDWEQCRNMLQLFSREIDRHFGQAFSEMAQELASALEKTGDPRWEKRILPLRKIIVAGDDVCFITAGDLGLECAASFIRHLSGKINGADGQPYSACAGIAVVHTRYPFRRAYDLAEELCTNAKKFCAACGGEISALDYHIEFSQIKDSLHEIRADYIAEDGTHMELRPVAVTATEDARVPAERQYTFLTSMICQMQSDRSKLARGKLKELRTAIAQGEWETQYALRLSDIQDPLEQEKAAYFTDTTLPQAVRRCLLFDAIELMDHTTLWGEDE